MKPRQTVLPPSSLVRCQAGPLAALAVLVVLSWVAVSRVPAAEEPTHPWQPLFKGIDTLSLTQEAPEPLSAFLVFLGARRTVTDSRNWNSLQALIKMLLATSDREMPSTNLPMDLSLPTSGV